MIPETDRAYIAGLFDGEVCVSYKQYKRKRPHNKKAYPTWQIRLEIAKTDQSVLRWIHEVLGVGTVTEKRYRTKYTVGWKKQWRWRCSHRDSFYVCRLIFPFTHVKMEGVQKILQHYAHIQMNDNVVDLKEYKKFMSLE